MDAPKHGETHLHITWDDSGFTVKVNGKEYSCGDNFEVQRVVGDLLDQILPADRALFDTNCEQMEG